MAYLVLAALGVLMAARFLSRTEHKAEGMAFLFTAQAAIGLADWITFGFFGMYWYLPGLVADPMVDAAIGELTAEYVFVPGLAMALRAVTSPVVGAAVGSALLTAIQTLFHRQGIFAMRYWSWWATALLFPAYFLGVTATARWRCRRGLNDPLVLMLRKINVLFTAFCMLTLCLRAAKVVVTHLHVLPTQVGNQSLARLFAYAVLGGANGYWVISAPGSARLARLGAGALLHGAVDLLLGRLHILMFRRPWNIPLDVAAVTLTIGAAGLVVDWISHRARIEI